MKRQLKPRSRKFFKFRWSDFFLTVAGISLATATSYFPYYVYNNTDKFDPPRMVFNGSIQADAEAKIEDDFVQPMAIRSRFLIEETSIPGSLIDPIMTASIGRFEPVQGALKNEPSMDKSDKNRKTQELKYELIFASSGHALVRDGEDVLPVSRGSYLPDGSTVISVRKRKGQWQVVTSDNTILAVKN